MALKTGLEGQQESVAPENKVIVLGAAAGHPGWPLILEAVRRPHKPTSLRRMMMSGKGSAPEESDLRVIDRVREAHIAALNQGSVDAWVGVFSEDAVQMPPNAPANVGRAMIRAWSQAFLELFRVEFALQVEEVRAAGDWAFERGGYTIRVSPKAGGDGFQDAGKYLTIYQKQADGAWLMARDIWNSNHPAPGMR
jgi:uncharacterized protein (TIGR02246 family)